MHHQHVHSQEWHQDLRSSLHLRKEPNSESQDKSYAISTQHSTTANQWNQFSKLLQVTANKLTPSVSGISNQGITGQLIISKRKRCSNTSIKHLRHEDHPHISAGLRLYRHNNAHEANARNVKQCPRCSLSLYNASQTCSSSRMALRSENN